MGTTIGAESNIRQVVVGRETIKKALGYSLDTFLEEEEFTHPQIPQVARLAGFRYASLAQLDTWGRAGCPRLDVNAMVWKGIDGTVILSVPKNALFGYAPDLKKLAASADFQKLAALGKPLVFAWEEFGWESSEQPAYLTAPARYQTLEGVEFVTLREYLDKYGEQAKEPVYIPMDAWNKSLTWGLGGDQIRILDRKVEETLLAAERFGAVAAALGEPMEPSALEGAWKDLLASQSHDVGLCEYSRWQGDRMAPFERIEDYHNFTWGVIGYNHLDAAQKAGEKALDASLRSIARRVGSRAGNAGGLMITAFNPCGWERSDTALTGRLYPVPGGVRDCVVKDKDGRAVPSQLIKAERDSEGNLVAAEVAFLAKKVPAVGYDTYRLEFVAEASPSATDLRIDEKGLAIENEHLMVRLDPGNGAIRSLVEKRSGRELINAAGPAFPALRGRPNTSYPLQKEIPSFYDSFTSKAEIDWLEKGPMCVVIRARHRMPHLVFETRVVVQSQSPRAEVISRVLASVPPAPDSAPADIKEGYWLSFSPAFQPESIVRDFPLGVEPTVNPWFHALTFVDLLGNDRALLVLHAGTQYFRREEGRGLSNLIIREWESSFTREYGWPRYAEYRHGLLPHGDSFTNTDRIKAAVAFGQPLLCVADQPRGGNLPPSKGFLSVSPPGVLLSAFRKKPGPGYELRAIEVEGREAEATVELGIPMTGAAETDLLGNRIAEGRCVGGRLEFKIGPWKIKTFEIL
jgi:alpha-mannosidase